MRFLCNGHAISVKINFLFFNRLITTEIFTMDHEDFNSSCLMDGNVMVECTIINNSEAEEEWEDDASICDVTDVAETSGQDRLDLTHPWPHLKKFFNPVVTKVKDKVRSKGLNKPAWKGKIKCVHCKASITYSTYSLYSLKSHYERVSKYWSACRVIILYSFALKN